MTPRLLLVTYEFPPMGGVGVQRVLKLAKYLPSVGWDVSVVTVDDPPAAMRDESLLAELPASVEIHRVWSWEPTRVVQAVRRRRARSRPGEASIARPSEKVRLGYSGMPSWVIRCVQALFIPDEKRLWRGRARRAGLDSISHDLVQAIVSSGPPNTAHLVARDLARRTGLPWIADFRDPWVGNYFFKPPTPLHAARQRHWESRVVRNASAVVVVSEPIAQDLRTRYPDRPVDHFVVIPNGFDPEDMPEPGPAASRSGPLTIAYLGAFQGSVSPDVFFEGLGRVATSGAIPRGSVRVRIIGPLSNEVTETAERSGLAGSVTQTGFLPHREALVQAGEADVLLLVLPPGPEGRPIVTGKLPEYLGLGRTVLALAPEGAAADIVRRAGAGPVVAPDDPEAVETAIVALYHARGGGVGLPTPDPAVASEFDRRAQVRSFARLLDRVGQSPVMMTRAEEERARDLYAKRDRDPRWRDTWTADNPLARFVAAGRQNGWAALLPGVIQRIGPASAWRVVEIGCGGGGLLPWFQDEVGVPGSALAGVDLSEDRIASARESLPDTDLRAGSAAELPWPDGSFDVVVASTLFSSVLDPGLRSRIAAEALRVLQTDGAVLWYDMRDDFMAANALHRMARPDEEWLGLCEISRMFPGCTFDLRPATLFLPFARPLVRVHPRLAAAAESAFPFFRGHYQGVIYKP